MPIRDENAPNQPKSAPATMQYGSIEAKVSIDCFSDGTGHSQVGLDVDISSDEPIDLWVNDTLVFTHYPSKYEDPSKYEETGA